MASSRIEIGSEVFVDIFVNQFFIKQASGVFFNSVLYLVCKVFSLFFVVFVVIQLFKAFVDVSITIRDDCTRSFICRFDNNIYTLL